ncbi:MAG TPA: cysteine-rich CWC family protein [Bacteroidales bacterium]
MKLKLTEEETCPRCGAKFDCGKSGKCWCYEVDLQPSVLENIQQNYDSCLCPACLTELAKGKA